jgi:hypothetical protein
MKKLNFFRRILARTPENNKVLGLIATGITTLLVTLDQSGTIDDKPIIKAGCEVAIVLFGGMTVYNAQKVDENHYNHKKDIKK